MMAAWHKVTVVLVIIASAAALKVARYGFMHAVSTGEAAAQVKALMAADGWIGAAYDDGNGARPFNISEFNKSGCSNAVAVAFLPGNAESAEFLAMGAAEEVVFFQGGVFLKRPSGFRRQLEVVSNAVGRMVGSKEGPLLPVIALVPVPDAAEGSCRGPSRAAWLRFFGA